MTDLPKSPQSDPIRVLVAATAKTQGLLITKKLEGRGMEVIEPPDGAPDMVKFIAGEQLNALIFQTSYLETAQDNLIQKLRMDHRLSKIAILVFGSTTTRKDEALRAGANRFVRFPHEADQIAAIVEDLVIRKRIVLVADDSNVSRSFISGILRDNGYDVMEAEDGQKALEALSSRRPDIVISDIEMPNMNGYQLCTAIKQDPETHDIPVIMLSSLTRGIEIEQGFNSGANDYLTKPVERDELLTRIQNHLEENKLVGRERILVVDDSRTIRNMLSQGLTQQGFTVKTANDGAEGLQAAQEFRPDVIITDYEMPEMDGFELCRALQNEDRTRELPVIMFTSREAMSSRASHLNLGVKACLTKPFSIDKLIVIVERVLAERKLMLEKEALRVYVSTDAWQSAHQKATLGETNKMWASEEVVTILFSDIVGFTRRCESITATEVVDFLNGYLDLMTEVIVRAGGFVDKFIGDAVMAIFPHRNTNGAQQAVDAAIGMQGNLDSELNPTLDTPLQMRIGINTGKVVLGEIGSRMHRRDYTVIGDNVNVAQRLESKAPHGGILVSEATWSLTRDMFSYSEPQTIQVKGRGGGIVVYEVKGRL